MKCSKCDKEMSRKEGAYIGICLELKTLGTKNKKDIDWLKKQWGKYYKKNVKYGFCWQCWLDSLMGGA